MVPVAVQPQPAINVAQMPVADNPKARIIAEVSEMFPAAAEAGLVAIFYNDAGGDKNELIKCCRRAGYKKVVTAATKAADEAASEALMRQMMTEQNN